MLFPQRSIVMLSGSARYEWKHNIEMKVTYVDDTGTRVIKPQDYRRVGLTFRN